MVDARSRRGSQGSARGGAASDRTVRQSSGFAWAGMAGAAARDLLFVDGGGSPLVVIAFVLLAGGLVWHYSVSSKGYLIDETHPGNDVDPSPPDDPSPRGDRRRERSRSGGPPDEIPGVPDLNIDRSELTNRDEKIYDGGNTIIDKVTLERDGGEVAVAVKRPRNEDTVLNKTASGFEEEARKWSTLDDHDHVVGLADWGTQPYPWIAMEHMDGGTLAERTGELPVRQALWTAEAIAEAVEYTHEQNYAHLDLKPANVMLRSVDGAWDVPKIGDWGLAKLVESPEATRGFTPKYAPPEQFEEGSGVADRQTDIFALGAVLYELFTGQPPFADSNEGVTPDRTRAEPDRPKRLVPSVPSELDDIIMQALERDKADRYQDASSLLGDLRPVSRQYGIRQ